MVYRPVRMAGPLAVTRHLPRRRPDCVRGQADYRISTRQLDGPAAAAVALIGQIVSIGIYLFATALVLEVIGFAIGPAVIVVLLAVAILLLLRPIVQNLSSGLTLQMRGIYLAGDVI